MSERSLRAQRLAALDRVPREVFTLLAAAETPLTAYDLLWRLQEKRGRRAPPSTIYRALARLVEARLAHRIESLGAFVVCTGPEGEHEPLFLICSHCHQAFELNAEAMQRQVEQQVQGAGFRVSRLNFVIHGCCQSCQSARRNG